MRHSTVTVLSDGLSQRHLAGFHLLGKLGATSGDVLGLTDFPFADVVGAGGLGLGLVRPIRNLGTAALLRFFLAATTCLSIGRLAAPLAFYSLRLQVLLLFSGQHRPLVVRQLSAFRRSPEHVHHWIVAVDGGIADGNLVDASAARPRTVVREG